MYFGLIVPAYSYAFCEAFTDSLGEILLTWTSKQLHLVSSKHMAIV